MENGKWKMENVVFLLPGSDFPGISLPLGEGGTATAVTDEGWRAVKTRTGLKQHSDPRLPPGIPHQSKIKDF